MLAPRNIRRTPVRSLLTILGIALGVSLYISGSSIVSGFRDQTAGILERYRVDVTVQDASVPTPVSSHIPAEVVDELAALPGVAEASPLVIGTLKTAFNPYFLVIGTPSGERLASRMSLDAGRLFAPGTDEVMLGRGAARRLRQKPGGALAIARGEKQPVVGVFASGHPMVDGAAVLDIDVARRLLKHKDDVSMVLLRAAAGTSPDDLARAVERLRPELSAVPGGKVLEQVEIFASIEHFARAISLIALLGCALVSANTATMAVTERTGEIGVLAACGWSPARILGLIMAEAALLGLCGGVAGNLLGLAVLAGFEATGGLGIGWVPSFADAPTVGLSMLLATGASLLGAIIPALRAARLDPAEALRHE